MSESIALTPLPASARQAINALLSTDAMRGTWHEVGPGDAVALTNPDYLSSGQAKVWQLCESLAGVGRVNLLSLYARVDSTTSGAIADALAAVFMRGEVVRP